MKTLSENRHNVHEKCGLEEGFINLLPAWQIIE